ncbi:twin-arginine translocase subunit TatC [Deinococcus sp. KSM4-11]|uniref:twin-arginine translocase subunit TatC n=1 Tax=Deinococcus sp. KSM4-11 TaxID=2568654 RepID=UPI0010A4FDA2|nr:twin-arginine translocase subunit TatC [Deinococcus sp. KSM4-11]THF87766.1 twin-arginine translocase subunit TatC [Deinococcus sp. KSM4-11]
MSQGADLKSAPLFDHLDELRKRLIICVVILVVAMAITFQYRTQLIALIEAPLQGSVNYQSGKVKVVTFNLTDQFLLSLNLSFWAGLALSLPLILGQVWGFIAPGLYPTERRWALPFIIGAGVSFLCGALFGYELVLPAMVKFLLDFGPLDTNLGLYNFIGLMTTFLVSFGLAFELPILAVILTKIGIVNHVMLRKGWRFALVAVMVAAAVITPTPDPGNMLMVAVPLYLLYELGVLLSRVFRLPPPEEAETPILGT